MIGQDYVEEKVFQVGDTVHITREDSARWFGTYTVEKVNPTTYVLTNPQGGRGLRAQHGLVGAGPLPGTSVFDPATRTSTFNPGVRLNPGTVVRARLRGVDPDQLWVVTGLVQKGHRIAPLGGSTRYYTGVSGVLLTVVSEIEGWKAE